MLSRASGFSKPPLIIPDGDIPTTKIIAKVVKEAFGDVEVKLTENLFGADVTGRYILISRLCHPSFKWLPDYFRDRNIRYSYFLDDNFWELTEEVDPNLADFFQRPIVIDTLDCFISNASFVIVMSKRLQSYIKTRFPDTDVHYIAPGFDVKAAQKLSENVVRLPRENGQLRIGYPTSRRVNITPLLVPVVQEVTRRHPGKVQFEFMGWMPQELEGTPGVSFFGQVDSYEGYLSFVLSRNWDLGIAPIVQGEFESFKTQVKYREYAGCGIPGLYSDVPPYTDYIADGETGLLVSNTPEDWIAAIEKMLADTILRKKIVQLSFNDVLRNFNQSIAAQQLQLLMDESLALTQ